MRTASILLLSLPLFLAACGSDADDAGVAAECTTNDDCFEEGQVCLTQFKGGYCGIQGCTSNADCPDQSGCVTHDDGVNYCFRFCGDKADCNVNRSVDNEANCSSSIDWVETDTDAKACVPPSGS